MQFFRVASEERRWRLFVANVNRAYFEVVLLVITKRIAILDIDFIVRVDYTELAFAIGGSQCKRIVFNFVNVVLVVIVAIKL